VTGANVAYAAEQGDKLAQRLMEREATLLGVGFVNALHTFSPEIILVGGGVVTSNPSLLEGARRVVQQHALADVYRSVPIEVAHLGPQVGVLGAAALVFATPNT
jgi:glucokinase